MYFLLTIIDDHRNNTFELVHGIKVCILEREQKAIVEDEFWGKTEITFEDNSGFCFVPEKKDEYTYLMYVNSYRNEDLENNFQKLYFSIGQKDDIEGFIVFLKSYPNGIKTNGETLFSKTLNETVVVLRDKQYLKFDGFHFENNNNHFVQVLFRFEF